VSDPLAPLEPLCPLGGHVPRIDTVGPVTLTEVTDTAIASFAARLGQESHARKVLASFTGGDIPGPGKATLGALSTVWTSPDQWFVIAPHATHEDLAAQLTTAAGDCASVTEQNDAWCRFDLTGAALADVFERLCPVNLRASTSGDATRTSIDHLGCFMIVHSADHITVLGPRSSAGSLHHALLTAMRSAL